MQGGVSLASGLGDCCRPWRGFRQEIIGLAGNSRAKSRVQQHLLACAPQARARRGTRHGVLASCRLPRAALLPGRSSRRPSAPGTACWLPGGRLTCPTTF